VRLAALANAPEAFASTLARELALDEAEWRRHAVDSFTFIAWRAGKPVGLAGAFPRQEGDPRGTPALNGGWSRCRSAQAVPGDGQRTFSRDNAGREEKVRRAISVQFAAAASRGSPTGSRYEQTHDPVPAHQGRQL
jgi:hypothetical protein